MTLTVQPCIFDGNYIAVDPAAWQDITVYGFFTRTPDGQLEHKESISALEMQRYLNFLDALRENEVTNMLSSGYYIAITYEIDLQKANAILLYWMQTFSQRHPQEKNHAQER
jgi:hypothetical protein